VFRRRVSSVLGAAILLIAAPVLAAAPAAAAAAQHCAGEAVAAPDGPVCFKTFSAAIAYATDGRVVLPIDATSVTQVELDLGSALSLSLSLTLTTVIGIDYEGGGYTGSTFVWYTTNAVGCSTGISYFASSMPSGWDNRVSSAKGFAGCNTYTHYQDPSYGGATQVCTCSTMGFMDNRTSSEQWHQ
jgi:hypothetical protein